MKASSGSAGVSGLSSSVVWSEVLGSMLLSVGVADEVSDSWLVADSIRVINICKLGEVR